ncbi:hypothetical protein GCM10008959_20310 [Deinococcus seoulensis]|uniref:DUF4197 domain-containing protein n=1 Tax=Deinococcus seoulensis TaxID=1837379 RepID=A0ABQ2RUN3_9DEIO|nr:hypothetical protein [Deinococcus seoulensis]GGR58559.1 hypothetical protein GCM10008959_20310 [Deinococcus seoulensis]
MKKLLLSVSALALFAPSVQAQSAANSVSGYAALLSIAGARGVFLSLATLEKLTPAQFKEQASKLRISEEAFKQLFDRKFNAAPMEFVVRAVLESATGKTLTNEGVKRLIAENPSLVAVNNLSQLATLINNPAAATIANRAATLATAPVTPRGGGN